MTRLPALFALFLLTSTGCVATGPNTPTSTDGSHQSTIDERRFTLGLGQGTALSDASRLSYTSLVNDSRCAPSVQCVWAGDAEIALRWKPASGSAQDLRLHTNAQGGSTSVRIGTRTLTLVSLERGIGPEATMSIEATP